MAKRIYDNEFKASAVSLVEQLGIRKAAVELGIPSSTLNGWVKSHNYDNTDGTESSAETETNEAAAEEAIEADDFDDDDFCGDDLFGEHFLPKEPEEEQSIYDEDIFGEENCPDELFTIGFDINSCMLPDSGCDDLYDEMCLDGCIKNYYFVDYENVKSAGLIGVENLAENDCLRIYYGKETPNIPFTFMRKLNNTPARVECTKVLLQIKNGADCQILFEILQAYKFNPFTNFFIISKDSDFDVPIEEFKKKFGVKIKKIQKISDAYNTAVQEKPVTKTVPDSKPAEPLTRDEQIDRIFDSELNISPYIEHRTEILNLIKTSPDKQTLHNSLQKLIPTQNVNAVLDAYETLLPQKSKNKSKKNNKSKADWNAKVKSTFELHFTGGIFLQKKEEILKAMTESSSKREINERLNKLIHNETGKIFANKELNELLSNIPAK